MKTKYPRLWDAARVESYTVDILDRHDRKIGSLDSVKGGSIVYSVDARIKTAGKLNAYSSAPIEWWADKRLQVWAHANGYSWSLGVFLPSSPLMNHAGDGFSYSIELSDKLTIIDQDALTAPLSLPKGTRLDRQVASMIRSVGETRYNITPSTKTNRAPLTWKAGTSKLTVIDDILDYMDYFALHATPNGVLATYPYVLPRHRPVLWNLTDSKDSITAVEYSHQQDLDNLPNRVVYVAQSTSTVVNGVVVEGEKQKPLVAYAQDASSNWFGSFKNRGRWITHVSTEVEAATQQEIQKKAERQLLNAREPYTKVELEHGILPLELNQIIQFKTRDYNVRGSVRRTETTLEPGKLQKTTLRRVNLE
ncbi:MAG: hypothetical protein SPI14_06070 [Arcanobacterium sp.]|nr:hypothetical protein [Arcanobacterium sp.]